ncbi:MAG: glutamyl-tRNA reductase [Anaerolineales bacterium]
MHFLCIGINHTTASLDLRQDLSYTEAEIRAALQHWRRSINLESNEMLILSTCNRTEIYAVLPNLSFSLLEKWLITDRGKNMDSYRPSLYYYMDIQVIKHIFRVASGLDSQVLGETQILGQVNRALEIARAEKTASTFLTRLFQNAIHAAKRAHSETKISHKPISIASLAVALALEDQPNPKEISVLLLGAGEMAEKTLEALQKRHVEKVFILNRTFDHAQQLATLYGYQTKPIQELETTLMEADLVITTLNITKYYLTRDQIKCILSQRYQRPLKLVDLGLPRNIDPSVGQLEGVMFWDLDHLNAQVEESLLQRQAEVPKVEKILGEGENNYIAFLHRKAITPFLSGIRQQAEQIRLMELEKTFRRMPELNEQQQKRIEAFSAALVKKILATQYMWAVDSVEDPTGFPSSEIAQSVVDSPIEHGRADNTTSIDEISWRNFSPQPHFGK